MNESDGTDSRTVSALRSSPGRLVFTEDGNRDGWIASDTTISLDVVR